MNTFSNNGVAVQQRRQRHLRAAQHAPQQRQRNLHRQRRPAATWSSIATRTTTTTRRRSQGQGQNADGFGVHYQTAGATTIVRGCRAWWNSDDGYDLINQEVPVTVENSWAMGNGYANYGTLNPTVGKRQRLQDGEQQDRRPPPGAEQRRLEEQGHRAFTPIIPRAGTPGTTTRRSMNGTQYNMLASPPDDPQHDDHPDGRHGAHHAEQHRLSRTRTPT